MRRARLRLFAFCVLCLALGVPVAVAGGDIPAGLVIDGAARVSAVIDGDTVRLDKKIEGADQVRLVGIQAPKLPLGRKGFKKWPLAEAAKAGLESLVLGKSVRLAFGGARRDRHGRWLAHLFLDDSTWVQQQMLGNGMARVYSFADNRTQLSSLYSAERKARKNGRGIWRNPFYAVRDGADEKALGLELGTFQLIEGRVRDAVRVKGTVYLNFGADWRRDFTARIRSGPRRLFKKAGLAPLSLKGARVRVRGWLDGQNGSLIDVTHPEQIEIGED